MAIKFSEPLGDPNYGPLLIRLTIGVYFIQAAIEKLNSHRVFLEAVKEYGELKESMATLIGAVLPYLEFVTGVLLILGMWTTLAALLASLIALGAFYVFKTYKVVPWNPEFVLGPLTKPGRGVFPHFPAKWHVLLLACSLSLLYSGAGAFSIDRFRKGGGS